VEAMLLKVPEVAQLLGMSRAKIYELMASGALRSVRVDGSRRVRTADVADFVARLDERWPMRARSRSSNSEQPAVRKPAGVVRLGGTRPSRRADLAVLVLQAGRAAIPRSPARCTAPTEELQHRSTQCAATRRSRAPVGPSGPLPCSHSPSAGTDRSDSPSRAVGRSLTAATGAAGGKLSRPNRTHLELDAVVIGAVAAMKTTETDRMNRRRRRRIRSARLGELVQVTAEGVAILAVGRVLGASRRVIERVPGGRGRTGGPCRFAW
jgi:excisionase family DNA binding protein